MLKPLLGVILRLKDGDRNGDGRGWLVVTRGMGAGRGGMAMGVGDGR